MTRLHHRDWQASLTRPHDWTALRQRISADIPVSKESRFSPTTFAAIGTTIFASTPWSSSGNCPGDERVRSWCWCHGPWEKSATPDAIASSIVDELRACHRWHLDVLAWIDASAPPGRDIDKLARLVAGVVDLVVGLGINDSWYPLIVPVVGWTLERHSFELPEDLAAAIDRLCMLSFTSWVAPPPKSRQDFAEEAVLAIIDQEMAVRWPDVD
jgi:hypothetical protein